MPILVLSQEFLLSQIKEGEDKIEQEQANLLQMIGHCANSLTYLSFNRDLGKNLSLEDKILFVEASNKLYQTIISDGNALFYHCRIAWNYFRIAELECGNGDRKKAMENLLLEEKSATEYDNCTKEQNYTSLFINRVKYNPKGVIKNWEGTERLMLYHRTTEGVFDSLRDIPEFVQLQERLKK
jgi:hypothetical protein